MTDTIELRKWAIEQAIQANPKDAVEVAKDILKFVQGDNQPISNVKEELEERGIISRDWSVKALTPEQSAVLSAMIKRFNAEEPISGVKIAKDVKLTQSCVSTHIRNLVALKYVGRNGNKFWPLRTIKGHKLPVTVVKLPSGVAKGYKGVLTATLKEVAEA
jgi:hypothetical protein